MMPRGRHDRSRVQPAFLPDHLPRLWLHVTEDQARLLKAALLPHEKAAHWLSKDPATKDLTRRKAAYASRLAILTITQINEALKKL